MIKKVAYEIPYHIQREVLEMYAPIIKKYVRNSIIKSGLIGMGIGAFGMRYYLKRKQKQQKNLVKKSNENNIVLTAFTDDQIKRLKRKNLTLGVLLGLGAGTLGTRYYLKRKQKNK